jgi:dimethylglycine dehydrogenase
VDAGEADVYGGEPVYSDQKVVGVTTSGAYGYAVQKSLALAFVNPEFAEPGSAFDIEILGVRCRAKVLAEPAYDPRNERLRS